MAEIKVICEGGSCPIKAKCQRYKPNAHATRTVSERPFVTPPYDRHRRGQCDHFQSKQLAEVML